MSNSLAELENNGFAVLNAVLSPLSLERLVSNVRLIEPGKAGTRSLLVREWCTILAKELKDHRELEPLLPDDAVAVQCTYFDKSESRNWLVALHRDQFIPVKSQLDSPGWNAWSVKEGVTFVRPPRPVLESLVSVRLHLDESAEANGPLEVVPRSHLEDEASGIKIACHVKRGGALVFRPLLLHASSKVLKGRRRVLHFVYGPPQLPDGMEWGNAV